MRVELKIRHDSIARSIVARVEAKLRRLERRLPRDAVVEVVLEREPGQPDDHHIGARVHARGPDIQAHAAGPTYETASDRVVETLERQIERRRDKIVEEPRRHAE